MDHKVNKKFVGCCYDLFSDRLVLVGCLKTEGTDGRSYVDRVNIRV